YRSSRNIPKFRANNDIIFDGEDSGLDITENKSQAINLSLRRLSNQYTPWIIRNTIDAMAFRIGTAKSYNRATTSVDSSRAVTAGANWSMRIADPFGIPLPNRWKLSVIPDAVSASYNISDQKSVNYNRDAADPTVLKKTRDNQLKNEGLGFNSSWHLLPPITFAISSQRDLSNANFERFVIKGVDYRPTLTVAGIDLGREVTRTERLTFTQSFNLTSFFRPRLSWTGDYSENHSPDITTSADIDSTSDTTDSTFVPPDLKTIENRSSTQVSWTIPVSAIFRKLAGTGRTTPRAAPAAGGTYKPPTDSPLAPPPSGGVPPNTQSPHPLAPPPDTTGVIPPGGTSDPEDGNLDAGQAATNTAAPPETPPPPTNDPKEIERRRKADEEARKKEGERVKKEAEQAKKDAEAAARWEAEEKKRVAKEAEEARKAEEEARKKEAKRLAEEKKKAESHGGIGGKKKKSEPSPPADSTLVPPAGAGSGGNPSLAPPSTAATPAPGDSAAGAPATTGGMTKAQADAEARRRQEETARRAEEERRRKEAEAERARKAAEPPVSLGAFLFRDLIQIGDIRTSFNVTDRNTANRVHGSPDLAYRLGLSSGLEGVTLADGSRVGSSNSVSASGNSAITLLKDITVDANFQWTETENETDRALSRTANTIWPGLRMNLNSLEKKLKLGRFFTSFSASSGYERRSEEQGTGLNRRERVTTSSSWRPLLQVDANWRNGVKTQFSADHSSQSQEQFEGSQAGAGVVSTHNTDTYRMTVAKSLVARGGLRGGARSTIDLNLDFTYSKDSIFNDFSNGNVDNGKATDNFQTRFSTSYRFTTNVSGSMQLNYGQRRDYEQGTADRTLGLQATAAITF
ncbi:MAG TPA: hypothetical protein VF720_01995, partial [Candidatus Eisenbacteria bacterium]